MAAIGKDDESNRVVHEFLDEPQLHALYRYLITHFKERLSHFEQCLSVLEAMGTFQEVNGGH